MLWTVLGKSPLYKSLIAFGRFKTALEAYDFLDSMARENTSVQAIRVAKVGKDEVFMPTE